jgi:hypothetical protein
MLNLDSAKKTGDCAVWYKIFGTCVTCVNVLLFYIVLYSFSVVCFHVVVDNLKLKQFERKRLLPLFTRCISEKNSSKLKNFSPIASFHKS